MARYDSLAKDLPSVKRRTTQIRGQLCNSEKHIESHHFFSEHESYRKAGRDIFIMNLYTTHMVLNFSAKVLRIITMGEATSRYDNTAAFCGVPYSSINKL